MLRLLHLSDLHFGPHSRLAGKDHARAGKSFHRALVESDPSSTKDAQGIDVVIVTGDLAEVGKPKEFELAREFLEALAGEIGIEPRRFVFCPGNHDISRPLCQQQASEQAIYDFDDDELRRRIDGVKLRFYDEFLERFYGTPIDAVAQPLGCGAFVHSFPEKRLSVAALNSCEQESHFPSDHFGKVSEAQAQALMDHWRDGEVASLKIVAVHHNPTTTVADNIDSWRTWLAGKELSDDMLAAWEGDVLGFEGRDRLKRIAHDCSVQLVLHGHHHAKDEHVWPWAGPGYAHVLSAGSLSLGDDKLPGTEPASFRVIELDAEAATLRAKAFVWVDWARTARDVESGTFRPDPAGNYEKALDLPAGFDVDRVKPKDERVEDIERSELASFIRTFRKGFRGAYSRWDLATVGVTQAGGAGRPIDVGLDDMYVPLRLGEGYRLDKIDEGSVIEPGALLQRVRPLAIRGSAGSGKTTWMRWTFRQLLNIERALPLMLVLRDLARHWDDTKAGGERSLEHFLDAWAAEQLGSGWEKGYVKQLLEAKDGPQPILLVDGWDELGSLGEQVRQKLVGLMRLYPRLRVVVSSRPYGEGRPSGAEGFEVLDLQPLAGGDGESTGEIETLAEHFFTRCYREEAGGKRTSIDEFFDALHRSPDAQVLARTPLLLTMMLLISRSSPLPDKRHNLYEKCIDSLLTARPERKEREGAKWLPEQWRPDDSDERKRAVAALAFGLQDTKMSPHSWQRASIVAGLDEASALLPDTWSETRRHAFLAWLAGPAGLLVDRSDETLTFAHLSFQEYLAASHLDATVEGVDLRVEVLRKRSEIATWRETLLLWAARIDKQNPQRLDAVTDQLIESETGLVLVGRMYADGLGSDDAFETWCEMKSPTHSQRRQLDDCGGKCGSTQ